MQPALFWARVQNWIPDHFPGTEKPGLIATLPGRLGISEKWLSFLLSLLLSLIGMQRSGTTELGAC